MIKIRNKEDCCGCWACIQRCPKHCITMVEDEEGFLYPKVDSLLCVDCGLCEKVCPVINQGKPRQPAVVYAAKNLNEEVRMSSSSGGVFTCLAEQVIAKGGIVFGARFNEEWDVVHDYTETKEGLLDFRGSKYVQSRIGECYQCVEKFLKSGREVLFSGTPCQIAGLKCFLQKEYENLLTVDFICHGVPSPGVWKQYLKEMKKKVALQCDKKNSVLSHPICENDVQLKGISFRNKRLGWKKFSFTLTFSVPIDEDGVQTTVLLSEALNKNLFLRGFLADLYLRPSCHSCFSKCLKSGSDITIGDYWGIKSIFPEFDDDKGVSVIIVNNEKNKYILKSLELEYFETSYEDVKMKNASIEHSSGFTQKRNHFYMRRNETIQARIERLCRPTVKQQIKEILYIAISGLRLDFILKKVKSIL